MGSALSGRIKQRTFWCPAAEREVTVEFIEVGIPGLRDPIAVTVCSAFEESSVVICRAPCLDPSYRLAGPPSGWAGWRKWRKRSSR